MGRSLRGLGRRFGFTQVLEDLDAVVVLVRDINPILLIDVKSGWNPKITIVSPFRADKKKKSSLLVEDLKIIERRVSNVNMALTISPYAFGAGKFAIAVSDLAEGLDEFPVEIEELNPEISRIAHVQFPVPYEDVRRKIEPALIGAATTNVKQKFSAVRAP